ncbi:MAG: solute carrier family 26 protein [Saprospiraceae bacterium]|nr:solute carrier family 26 protein [Saprospiraceae bacterium]
MKIKDYMPILEWLPSYDKRQLPGDLSAGLTVGVMLIPQGMAYAMIAGLPPIYGLYASTLPLIIYALLGTSRQLAVGPVAMVSLLTAAGVGSLAVGGTETYIALAITLALFVGLIQFLLGAFRLGFLVNFLSHPVISGFTSAAALIIGLSQLKHLLGVEIARSHYVHEIVVEAMGKIGEINWSTLAIGLGGVLLIIGAKRLHKAIPGPLLAVVFGILLVWGMGLQALGVKIVGEVPGGLPSFGIPQIQIATAQDLLPIALAIALVSFMESIAVAKAIQAKHKDYKVIANQELIALGAANIGGAFLQSYPVTGGFSRTAVNDQAGAKTGLASIFSAALIVLTLLFLTPLFYYLPKAILASVIMVAVFGLIDVKEAKHLWKADRSDFWMLIITFLATLGLGIEQGIGIGVILSLAIIIFRTSRPHIAELGQVPGTPYYRNVERFDTVLQRDDLLIIRLDAQLYFANIDFFKDRVHELLQARLPKVLRTIILNAESINAIDSTAMHALSDLVEDWRKDGLAVYLTGVKGPVRDAMVKGGVTEKIGKENFFISVQEAVDEHLQQRPVQKNSIHQAFVLQTNVET